MTTLTDLAAQLVPEETITVRERVARALRDGGRARVTVTSKASGEYLTVKLACKKRRPEGKGFISRARKEGRVGILAADVVFCDGSDNVYAEEVGRLWTDTGVFTEPSWGDAATRAPYAWAARRVLAWALNGDADFAAQAEVELAAECAVCGHALNDPLSIERGIGPECYGKQTGSKHV